MKINDFKHLHNIEVHLGRAVTVVCGLNATGKSTILSLLGHSAKDVSITLLGKKFETVYQDIMKAKYDLETKNSRCVEFTICDNTFENDVETFWYRAYWNYEDKPNRRRYRVLPVRTLTGKKDKKYDCPSLYMGLSRLYPVGESRSAKIEDFVLNRTQEDSEYIKTNHGEIRNFSRMSLFPSLTGSESDLSGPTAAAKARCSISLPDVMNRTAELSLFLHVLHLRC